ncbi:MAG: hypothetical protein QOI54_2865 [Actinomycetota bacterium]|nr:hypothetical protein [Actinomycetota bacterium]
MNLDEVGESELLAWFTALGVIGKVPGSLLTYQEMSHHGHGVVQFLPDRPERKEWLGRDVPLCEQFVRDREGAVQGAGLTPQETEALLGTDSFNVLNDLGAHPMLSLSARQVSEIEQRRQTPR